ncbi:MAG: amino acid permease [Planctomycetes bacterium]|nr:amino acid permease [Planctomycetota bacterium]
MELKRELNLLDVFCVASGAMISSGLFILPGLAHAQAGPALVVSYFLAGLLALTGMLSQAELVSAMPKAGGTYFYVTRAMGPAVGTINGLLTWFSLSLKAAFALAGMAAFAALIVDVTDLQKSLISVMLGLVFVGVNLVGIKEAGRVQVVIVLTLLALLILYVARGLPAVDVRHFEPFAPKGIVAIFSTAGFVFISYGGLVKVASIAEEVKDASRVVPLGMILSLLVVSILYTLVVFVTTGVLGSAALNDSLTPITDGAAAFMGPWGKIVLSVAAILAFVSTANAGIMAAARYPLALSRDNLLPESFSKVHKRFKTPHVAILLTGLFVLVAVFLKLEVLVKVASTVLILSFMFSCLSVIVLRESRLQNYQPRFHAPLYPWVQIAGIIGFGFLIFEMGSQALLVGAVLVIGGLFVYWFYGRIRTTREFALLHLIERITAKDLTTHLLETELKEIIRERDEIVKDRFDRVIEDSIVLDIQEPTSAEELFKLVSDSMSRRLKIEPSVLLELLKAREADSSTAISPTLAIPHIIIEGEETFDILLARCREGAAFSEEAPNVRAIFVIVGTRDQRNFHLRALAAIAQIVQHPHFDKAWLSAKDIESLRDTVLLGKRRRTEK